MSTDAHALTTTTADHGAAEHGHSGGIGTPVLGMLLFLTSEIMFFAGLFAAYFNIRANAGADWPPAALGLEGGNPLHLFPLVLPATVLLVISSFTCQFGIWAIKRNDRVGLTRWMAVTVALGVIFLVMQGIDYALLIEEGVTLGSGTFGTTYFTLTGFHGAHVFGGVLMLAVVLYRSMAGQVSARHHDAVEATSLYWHFVDVVWILLFAILYIIQ